MGPKDGNAHLNILREHLKKVRNLLNRASAKQVQAQSIINSSKELITQYFNDTRPVFQSNRLDDESLGGLDNWMQQLLTLTQKLSLKSKYNRTVKSIEQELNGVEIALVTATTEPQTPSTIKLDGKEQRIATTLAGLIKSAGLSYEQACMDLRDDTRCSYRGAAAELRETLREVLDQLAPDKEVVSQNNFKLEKDQKKPTMKQKVRYILKSRGKNKSQTEAPESAVTLVDEKVGALARSVYNRFSASTHISTSKQEVRQIKAYVDVVLGELLEIA